MAEDRKKSVYECLSAVDVKGKAKEKNGLTYLPWSSAWGEVLKAYPDATFEIVPQVMDELGNARYWHDDGRTGWVEVSVTIGGKTVTEILSIMNYKNVAIPAAEITSVDANKSVKRCLVKAIAMHGLGLYIYEGEDLPEEAARLVELKGDIKRILDKKCATEAGRQRAGDLCKAAEREANPSLGEESITGNYNNIDDAEMLERLKKQLLAIRA